MWVHFGERYSAARRCAGNPILKPSDIPPTHPELEVCCVMNAGALRRDGVTYLMLRVDERPHPQEGYVGTAVSHGGKIEILRFRKDTPGLNASDPRGFTLPDGRMLITVLSHLRVARSHDGERFTVDPQPAIFPTEPYEAYAAQDARLTEIDGTVSINYSAVSDYGIATALATTRDFVAYERHGLIFAPDNRNVCLFPRRIDGWYYALHRPMHAVPIGLNSVWLARSQDLIHWGGHRRLMAPSARGWDDHHIGGGAPPIETPDGWLIVYHGSSVDNRYCLGVALLDRDDPSRVLARHEQPLLEPGMDYEKKGFFGNVVFTDGAVVQDGLLRVYYGASDTVTCLADFELEAVLQALRGGTKTCQ
jgi:predicted GH43/DUF377 family glycosyl hydrolase